MITILIEYRLGLLDELPFRAVDLIGMDVVILRQLFYALSFLESVQANLCFEGRSESSLGCLAHFLAFKDEYFHFNLLSKKLGAL